jgi:hypothetical protein
MDVAAVNIDHAVAVKEKCTAMHRRACLYNLPLYARQ